MPGAGRAAAACPAHHRIPPPPGGGGWRRAGGGRAAARCLAGADRDEDPPAVARLILTKGCRIPSVLGSIWSTQSTSPGGGGGGSDLGAKKSEKELFLSSPSAVAQDHAIPILKTHEGMPHPSCPWGYLGKERFVKKYITRPICKEVHDTANFHDSKCGILLYSLFKRFCARGRFSGATRSENERFFAR